MTSRSVPTNNEAMTLPAVDTIVSLSLRGPGLLLHRPAR
jgi:hypothetical protein